jgi:N-terminal domain of (some) glycogen debranching enzymes
MLDTVNILEGNTFVTSDRRGDIDGSPVSPHGLFALDTRFLSRWRLTLDGQSPVLSTDTQRYYGPSSSLRRPPERRTSTRRCLSCVDAGSTRE